MLDSEVEGELVGSGRPRRSAEERRLIMEETLEAGASVATVISRWSSWRAFSGRAEVVAGDGIRGHAVGRA
jgi:hypothetical protein